MHVLDEETGKSLEYCQISHHTKYKDIWNHSYYNELGQLCQGIGTDSTGTDQNVSETNIFVVIHYKDIPVDRRK